MDSKDLSQQQLDLFSTIERVCSVFSLIGCVFIISTFCLSSSFHKPINRLVFYASFGNLMTNVATLMARTYVEDYMGAACQFQAFLIQMFMPADAFWTLAMAVNVYLTFYYKFDAQMLRKMEIPYLLTCYGIPFCVALSYIFVRSPTKGPMYGNATLWCWISSDWDVWRIATFYGPVWVAIAAIFFIYIRCGGEIYRKHKQLNDLNYTSMYEPEPLPMNDIHSSKTTEVHVTTEEAPDQIDLTPLGGRPVSTVSDQPKSSPTAAYSVHISSATRSNSMKGGQRESFPGLVQPAQGLSPEPVITATTTAAPAVMRPTHQSLGGSALRSRTGRGQSRAANNAAWSYAKCALLFFTALLVTWIPSSANRVYSVVNVNQISLPLEYMSAFVLPLQGFWNAVIYIMTSWKACTNIVDDIMYDLGRAPPVQEIAGPFVAPGSAKRQQNNTKNNNGPYGGGVGNGTRQAPTFQLHTQPSSRPDMDMEARIMRNSDKGSYASESTTDLTSSSSRPSTSRDGVKS